VVTGVSRGKLAVIGASRGKIGGKRSPGNTNKGGSNRNGGKLAVIGDRKMLLG